MNTAETTLRAKLDKLECHFTWGIDRPIGQAKLQKVRNHLDDIGTEEGYPWLGHICNLKGFIHYKLGQNEAALQCLYSAGETFRQINNTVTEEGPWLLVNYGNLAWLNFHLNKESESQDYLKKVEALQRDYPSPSQEDKHHPEVYAEKAWTLMKFSQAQRLKAIEYFQKAIRVEPDKKEWQTSHVLAINIANEYCSPEEESEILEKLRIAKEHDPENTYLASVYLLRLARKQQVCEDEIRKLAKKVLSKPIGAYSGLRPLLRVYRTCLTQNEAIDLAQEALDRQPNERYLKARLATSYRWKVISGEDSPCRQSLIGRGISLFQEVISLYPESSLKAKLDLANLCSFSANDNAALADQIFQELLTSDLDPVERQLLHTNYAQYLFYRVRDSNRSINHHMMTVEIPNQNKHRDKSAKILKQIVQRGKNRRCAEIKDFLERNSVYN